MYSCAVNDRFERCFALFHDNNAVLIVDIALVVHDNVGVVGPLQRLYLGLHVALLSVGEAEGRYNLHHIRLFGCAFGNRVNCGARARADFGPDIIVFEQFGG